MKEQTLLNMKHDMGKLAEAMHNTIRDLVGLNTLTQGLLQTVQLMPGYEEAIKGLQEKLANQEAEPKIDLN
jgi:hypothetical protein|tara:strand:+ start:259 stop:471 length:213 start_codon:yes stop_codon:yes gene_type:complete